MGNSWEFLGGCLVFLPQITWAELLTMVKDVVRFLFFFLTK